MGGYFSNAGVFLVETVFGLVLLAVMLRFLLQLVHARFNNPVAQFLVKVTNPLLVPVRRLVPGVGGIDMASIVLLVFIKSVEILIVNVIVGASIHPISLFVLVFAGLLDLLIKVYLYGLLIQVIASWIAPGNYNPALAMLHQINEPVMAPARKIMPPISGMDLSPILVMVALQLASMLLVAPLVGLAMQLGQ